MTNPHYSICAFIVITLFTSPILGQPIPIFDNDLTRLGACYRGSDYEGALACLDKLAHVAEPIKAPLTVLKARVYVKMGKSQEAIELLEELRKGQDLSATGQLAATTLLASLQYSAKRYTKAIPLLQSLLTTFPHHRQRYELRFKLADALHHAGRKRESVEEFLSLGASRLQKRPARLAFKRLYRQFVANSFPRSLKQETWLDWGRLLLKKRHYTKALDVVVPMIEAAEPKKRSKKKKKKSKLWRNVGKLSPKLMAEAYILGGEIELRRKNGWWARRLFLNATKQKVGSATKAKALFLAGEAMYRISLYGRAKKHYRNVLSKYPKSTHAGAALFKLAVVAKREGKSKTALANYQRLVKKYPKSWFSKNVAWEMGLEYYEQKKWRSAAKSFGDFCRVAPKDRLVPTAQYWQAKALSHAKDWTGVRKTLKSLLEWPLPGLYHLAAVRHLKRPKSKGFPKGLPMPRFDNYENSLMLLVNQVPTRPRNGWKTMPEHLRSDVIERVALLKESSLWEPLADELERLVHLNSGSGPLRNNLAWAYERLGDFPGAIEQGEIIMSRDEPFKDIDRGLVLDKLFPRPARLPFKKYAKSFKVHRPLVYSVAREESRFDPELVSWAGAKGVMQVMNSTGRWICQRLKVKGFEPERLYDPKLNVRLGCWYLDYLATRFKGLRDALLLVISSYNAGPGNVSRWLKKFDGEGGFETFVESWHLEETRFYVKKVARALICYELLDGPIDG